MHLGIVRLAWAHRPVVLAPSVGGPEEVRGASEHMRKLSAAMRRMTTDPDIQAEARATGEATTGAGDDRSDAVVSSAALVPLNVVNRTRGASNTSLTEA